MYFFSLWHSLVLAQSQSVTRLHGVYELPAQPHTGQFPFFVFAFVLFHVLKCVSHRSMVGALNKLPVAASGLIFFGDPVTFSSVTGIFTGFVAGLVYALAKQTQSKSSRCICRLDIATMLLH